MIDLTMWVLHKDGCVWRDRDERVVMFDTRNEAVNYGAACLPFDDNGWKVKKVKVTDANKG